MASGFLDIDFSDAMVLLMKNYSDALQLNIGCGKDMTIRKLLDTTRLGALGWTPPPAFEDGLKNSYAWFLENVI